jgi:hypothetical protein
MSFRLSRWRRYDPFGMSDNALIEQTTQQVAEAGGRQQRRSPGVRRALPLVSQTARCADDPPAGHRCLLASRRIGAFGFWQATWRQRKLLINSELVDGAKTLAVGEGSVITAPAEVAAVGLQKRVPVGYSKVEAGPCLAVVTSF